MMNTNGNVLGNRKQRAEAAAVTLSILDSGYYELPSGTRVSIADALDDAIDGTVSYPADASLPRSAPGTLATRFEVCNETTLAAARRLAATERVLALNFASAKHPGGGFLKGARAQEESLAVSSGLYACIADDPMYEMHRRRRDPMYTHAAIYSPDVPVFRDDDGRLLAEPYRCSFLTCAAVNAGAVLAQGRGRQAEISRAMDERIDRVLAIARAHEHRAVVLGAWGCGVFGNDSHRVAALFHDALTGPFAGAFSRVVFAILDRSADQRWIGPFQRRFAP
jgi:uncharacterized protein (TIGR02452 family)